MKSQALKKTAKEIIVLGELLHFESDKGIKHRHQDKLVILTDLKNIILSKATELLKIKKSKDINLNEYLFNPVNELQFIFTVKTIYYRTKKGNTYYHTFRQTYPKLYKKGNNIYLRVSKKVRVSKTRGIIG